MATTNAGADSPPTSCHERFRQIMEAAAGTALADYGGYGKFWNLPLPALRQFELYGTAMMRPADDMPPGDPVAVESSYHISPASVGAPRASSESAGLILGLRGKFPFDGTQFPPLPWGGRRVAEPDILLIAGWIAAGCPSAEEERATAGSAPTATQRQALASGAMPHPLLPQPINQLAHDTGTLKARKNVEFLGPEELRRLRAAIRQMKSLDQYPQDDRSFAYWARIHANQCQHGWEEFLTWHRAYLYGFEKQLQDIDSTVTLPYWDWAGDAVNVQISIDDMGSDVANDNGCVPKAFRCWIDEDGLRTLTDSGSVSGEILASLKTILGKEYSSGARAYSGPPRSPSAPTRRAMRQSSRSCPKSTPYGTGAAGRAATAT